MLSSVDRFMNPTPAGVSAEFFGQSTALSAWRTLWNNANTSTQLIYLFGDSQETEPNGTEAGYVARLNYELFQRFGKCGMVMNHYIASYGVNPSYGMWLTRAATPGTGAIAATTAQMFPGCILFGRLTDANGYCQALTYDASTTDPAAQIPAATYFPPGAPIFVDVWGKSRASSKEMTYIFGAHNTNSPNFSPNSGTISTGTTTIGLNNADGAFRSQSLGPFTNTNPATNPYNQIVLRSTSGAGDGNDADIHLIRFRKQTDTGGIYVHPFGVGGYDTDEFLINHASSGPMAQAFPQPNAIMLGYATNDLYGSGKTTATIVSDYTTLISTLRGATFFNNANLLVIIKVDVPRNWTGNQAYVTQHNLLYAALQGLAATDANLIILNSKGAVLSAGWADGTAAIPFLVGDFVHYNGNGARTVAEKEVQQLAMIAGAG